MQPESGSTGVEKCKIENLYFLYIVLGDLKI